MRGYKQLYCLSKNVKFPSYNNINVSDVVEEEKNGETDHTVTIWDAKDNYIPYIKQSVDLNALQNQKLCLCLLGNDDYMKYIGPMLTSFIYNNQWYKGDIVILYDDDLLKLSSESRCVLKKIYPTIKFHLIKNTERYSEVIKKYQETSYNKRWDKVFYKYEMFSLTEYDKILLLDGDMIINGDIREIFACNCDFGVVFEPQEFVRQRYFNAGLLYCGNKGYITPSMTETLIQETLKYEAFSCPEQDVLNLYMKDKGVTIFPIEFNDPVNIWGHYVDYKKAKIIHFWSKYEVLNEDEHMIDKRMFELYERLFQQKIQN